MVQYRIIVTGSRNWNNVRAIHRVLQDELGVHGSTLVVMHGNAKEGADAIAHAWCQLWGVREEIYEPEWLVYSKFAGLRRSQEMVQTGAHRCYAFIAPCLTPRCIRRPESHGSHGATYCADYAESHGIETIRNHDWWTGPPGDALALENGPSGSRAA